MSIQTINLGNYANDGTGDDLRTAFTKVNANFALLGTTLSILDGANLGTGKAVFAQRNNDDLTLEFKTLTSSDDTIEIDDTDPTVLDLKSKAILSNDPNPTLNADLNLNGHNIVLGGQGTGQLQTTVWGIDVRNLNAMLELMLVSNSVTLDFGTIIDGDPSGPYVPNINLDMNGGQFTGFSVYDPAGTNLDFGNFS